jgi:hypothetical protein
MKAVRLEKNDYLFIDLEDPETGPFALEIHRDQSGTLHVKSNQELVARLTGDGRLGLVGKVIEMGLNPHSPCPSCKGSGEDDQKTRTTSGGTVVPALCSTCKGSGRRGRSEDGS